jgi:hypothetical protein
MAMVFKLTRPGADITSTDGRDFVIDSDYKNLKAKDIQTTSQSLSGATVTKKIAHGLGYAPKYVVYVEIDEGTNSGKWFDATSGVFVVLTDPDYEGSAVRIQTYSDATYLGIWMQSYIPAGSPAYTVNIKYVIIIDPK